MINQIKNRQKEEELRLALDPKYAHLSDDLHVEISALGPPAEAHARIAFALAEVYIFVIVFRRKFDIEFIKIVFLGS